MLHPGFQLQVSVSLHVMEGRYDSALEWPMVGKFQVQILNQEQNESHLSTDTTFTDKSDIFDIGQVCIGEVGEKIGSADFDLTSRDPYILKDTMYRS